MQSNERYAVTTAPGYHGDWAAVLSTHRSLAAAKRAAQPTEHCRYAVIEVGPSVKKGDRLPAAHITFVHAG